MSEIHDRIAASFEKQGLMATLGAELLSAQEGEVQIGLPFSLHLSQQQGFIHAGAITSIVDSACGYAALTKAPPGHEVVTAEFKLNLLRPAIGERFVAIGKVVALMQATIVNVKV
ncbi:PaaI family thioesterase [Brachymonas denitrificans]|uniref:PaaI family thioesterase n=1 Tax=Brachymonas denitrificans TaxID=28220 RepID=UPI002AFECAB2|nr:PaaI family thioesterase [Brachymonas denitrificans]